MKITTETEIRMANLRVNRVGQIENEDGKLLINFHEAIGGREGANQLAQYTLQALRAYERSE